MEFWKLRIPRYQINYELIWKVSVNSSEFSELVCEKHICFSFTHCETHWFECERICLLEFAFMLIRHFSKKICRWNSFICLHANLIICYDSIHGMLSTRRACKSVKAFKPPDHSITLTTHIPSNIQTENVGNMAKHETK